MPRESHKGKNSLVLLCWSVFIVDGGAEFQETFHEVSLTI